VKKSFGKRPLGRTRNIWGNDIKMGVPKIGTGSESDSISLVQAPDSATIVLEIKERVKGMVTYIFCYRRVLGC
jgi:hypothetical protein